MVETMRRFIPYILIIVFILGITLGPLGVKAEENNPESCIKLSGVIPTGFNWPQCFAGLGETVLSIVAKILVPIGGLFDAAIDISIKDFGSYAKINGINTNVLQEDFFVEYIPPVEEYFQDQKFIN